MKTKKRQLLFSVSEKDFDFQEKRSQGKMMLICNDDGPLDPKIKELVLELRDEGFDTYSSCEGGKNHAFQYPTVRMYLNEGKGHLDKNFDKERKRLHKFLKDRKYQCYQIRYIYDYHSKYSLLELEFYGQDYMKKKGPLSRSLSFNK